MCKMDCYLEFSQFIGIDVSKKTLDVFDYPAKFSETFDNTDAGAGRLLVSLPKAGSCLIVLEASGAYEKSIVMHLVNAGHVVSVVNARQVRDFVKALGILAKTDRIDAEITKLVKADDKWKGMSNLIQSVPGVGEVTATTLIAEVPELGHLNR